MPAHHKSRTTFLGMLDLELDELTGSLLFSEFRSLMFAFSCSFAEFAETRFTAAWLKETRLE